MADIDSIFASSKGKAKLAPQPQIVDKEKPRSKKSVGKPTPVTQKKQPPQTASPKKPQTVVDPSLRLSSSKPSTSNPDKPSKKRKKTDEDEERFKDSRGSGPRRKTEEGFLIYKEDELGISGTGGDTPLCPFDCQCCF